MFETETQCLKFVTVNTKGDGNEGKSNQDCHLNWEEKNKMLTKIEEKLFNSYDFKNKFNLKIIFFGRWPHPCQEVTTAAFIISCYNDNSLIIKVILYS